MVSITVCSTHCSCAANIHLIPASGDDEVYHVPVSRAVMRPHGLVCILLFEHGVGHYYIEHNANGSSPMELHFQIPYFHKAESHLSLPDA